MLTIRKYHTDSLSWGDSPIWSSGKLVLNKQTLIDTSLGDLKNYELDFEIAQPGDNTRIIHITDAVRPAKKAGGISAFPGWTAGENQAGRGITFQLENVVVM